MQQHYAESFVLANGCRAHGVGITVALANGPRAYGFWMTGSNTFWAQHGHMPYMFNKVPWQQPLAPTFGPNLCRQLLPAAWLCPLAKTFGCKRMAARRLHGWCKEDARRLHYYTCWCKSWYTGSRASFGAANRTIQNCCGRHTHNKQIAGPLAQRQFTDRCCRSSGWSQFSESFQSMIWSMERCQMYPLTARSSATAFNLCVYSPLGTHGCYLDQRWTISSLTFMFHSFRIRLIRFHFDLGWWCGF